MYKYILDADGEPVVCEDVFAWAIWLETADRCVALDELPGGVVVSTVFLALDQAFGGGPPILWETMLFVAGEATTMRRYSSRGEALAGHAETLAALQEVRAHARARPSTPTSLSRTHMLKYGCALTSWQRGAQPYPIQAPSW